MAKKRIRDVILEDPLQALREMGKDLFLIGQNVAPFEGASFAIDLLAVDPQGHAVVIMVADAVQASDTQVFLGRALMAASLIARWEAEELFSYLSEDEAEELGGFLEAEVSEINESQRVMLIAGSYDEGTLSAAEWLRDHYGLGITCLEVGLATDPNNDVAYLLSTEVLG